MPSEDLRQRLTFLGLDDTDRRLLRDLRPSLEKNADTIVAAFYRHLLSYDSTRKLLRDPEVKQRLLAKQREYLLTLADPRFDEAFVDQRRQIGLVHERIGLEPRWYIGAYSTYFSLLVPYVDDVCQNDCDRCSRTLVALQRLLTFDAQLALEAYIEAHEKDMEFLTHELASEGQRLARDFEQQAAALRRTARRAQAAEELASLATLVAGLAHEIGTPMGVIQGHAKLLESAVSGENATWRLKTIQEQITRISRIIQTLLNMARPGPARRQPVALPPLIESTLSFVAEKLARRRIRVVRTLDPTVPSVLGDAERLQQLLLNLVLNAADAMPEGGELRVSLAAHNEDELAVRVADTGKGIPERELPHIFDPFFTTKAAGEGNGLGLMVAKGIATDHGGRIEVSSVENQGTEFVVCLPMPDPGEGGS